MAEIIPSDGLQSTLAAAITAAATTLTIQNADYPSWPGGTGPGAAAAGTYRCVLYNDANNGPWEIVTVTGGYGTATLTISRASEAFRGAQTAQAWAVGTTIVPVLTQGGLAALLAAGGSGTPGVLGSKLLLDYSYAGADISASPLTSSTWTTLIAAQQFNVDDPTALVEIDVSGFILVGDTAATFCAARVLVDGTIAKSVGGAESGGAAGQTPYANPLTGAVVNVGALASGVHTVALQLNPSAATNVYLRPSNGREFAAMRVFQRAATVTGPLSPGGSAGDKLLLNYVEATDLANNTVFAANTWINVGSAKTFTVDDVTAVVEVLVGGMVSASFGGDLGCAVLVDGVTRYQIAGSSGIATIYPNILSGSVPLPLTGLSVGQHTLQVQFNATASGHWWAMCATQPTQYVFTIRVWQRPTVYRGGRVPSARLSRAATFAVPAATWTAIPWDTLGDDNDNITNVAGAPTRFTCQTAGKYTFGASFAYAGVPATGGIRLRLNGSTILYEQEGPSFYSLDLTGSYPLNAGDYVEVQAYASVAETITPSANQPAVAWVQRQGDSVAPQYPTPGAKLMLDWAATTDIASGTALAANTWADVPGSTQSFNVDDPTAVVNIEIGGFVQIYGPTASGECGCRLVLDTTVVKPLGGQASLQVNNGVNVLAGAAPVAVTGLRAGAHTLKLQVFCTAAASIYCRASQATFPESLYERVWQIPQQSASYGVAAKVILNYELSGVLYNPTTFPIGWSNFGPAQSFVVDDPNAAVEIIVGGQATYNANTDIDVAVVIDGGARHIIGGQSNGAANWTNFLVGLAPYFVTGLGVGSHTVQVQIWLRTVASSVYLDSTVNQSFIIRALQISQGAQPPAPQYGFEVVLTQAQAVVTLPVSGLLPQGFRHLKVRWQAKGDAAANAISGNVILNGDTSASYDIQYLQDYGTTVTPTGSVAQVNAPVLFLSANTSPAGGWGAGEFSIENYSAVGSRKYMRGHSIGDQSDASNGKQVQFITADWRGTAAVTSITITASSGNFVAGSVFTLTLEGPPVSPPGIPGPGASPIKGPEVQLTAAQATITLPVIGQLLQNYRHLRVKWQARADTAGGKAMNMQCNGDTAANYDYVILNASGAAGGLNVGDDLGQTSFGIIGGVTGSDAPAGSAGSGVIEIDNYSGTTFHKEIQAHEGWIQDQVQNSGNNRLSLYKGRWRNTNAITSLTFTLSAGNFVAGSVFTLYYEP